MTAQSNERISACRKDMSGPTRQARALKRTAGWIKPGAAYFLMVFVLMAGTFLHRAPAYGATLQLHVQDSLLSLTAADADLSAVLQRLGEAAGIEIRFPAELNKKVTLQISGVGLETALKRMLKGLNYALLYSVPEGGGPSKISAVYVYGKQKGGTGSGPSMVNESGAQHSISDYEKRIKVVQQRLEKVERDSQAGRRYQKEIENYRRLIERLKIQK